MKTKNKKSIVRFNMQIDNETIKMIKIIREKHHINVSSLCREAIVNMYQKLEEVK